MRLRSVAASVGLALVATGCTTRMGDLTVASVKNMPREFQVIARDVQGIDCLHMVLFIPLGKMNPTLDGALDDALEKLPEADAMVDAVVHQDSIFTLLYNRVCFRVNGTAIRTRG